MRFFNDPNQIPFAYGVRIAIGFIVYFLLMQIAGLSHEIELRLFNLLILIGGIYLALRKFRQTHAQHLHYFRGMFVGIVTATIGSFIFSVFLFLYMILDPAFLQSIIENEPMGRFLNPYVAAGIVTIEGVFSGLFVTFLVLNLVRTDEVNEQHA